MAFFALDNEWVWDHWVTQHRGVYHLFFLYALKDVCDVNQRDYHASLGHATSLDLTNWTRLPDTITPGAPGSHDSLAIGSGCAVSKPSGGMRIFYTALSKDDNGQINSVISWADSDDCVHFVKGKRSFFAPDDRYYDVSAGDDKNVLWGKPFVFNYAGTWQMYFTARVKPNPYSDYGKRTGIVGYATSPDLDQWTAQPPMGQGGQFTRLDSIQARNINGKSMLIFSAPDDDADGHVWVAPGQSLLGPWRLDESRYVTKDIYYGAQVFPTKNGAWRFTGYCCYEPTKFIGQISDMLNFDDVGLSMKPRKEL